MGSLAAKTPGAGAAAAAAQGYKHIGGYTPPAGLSAPTGGAPTGGGIGGGLQPASARAPSGGSLAFVRQGTGPTQQPGGAPQPATTQLNIPAYQPPPAAAPPPGPEPYTPYDPQSSPMAGDLRELAGKGSGLMDPNSDYYKELVSQMRGDIGAGSAAQKRALALGGAESGFGAGGGAAMMSGIEGIDEANRIATGNAMGDISLEAPRLGASMMSSTFGPGAQLQGMGEQSSQFGAGLQERGVMDRARLAEGGAQWRSGEAQAAQQYGGGMALQQQQMADQRAQTQAAMQQQQQQWLAQFQQQEDQFAAQYGGAGGGGIGSGVGGGYGGVSHGIGAA